MKSNLKGPGLRKYVTMTHGKQAFLVGVEGNLLKARRVLNSIESENHKTLREGFQRNHSVPLNPTTTQAERARALFQKDSEPWKCQRGSQYCWLQQ